MKKWLLSISIFYLINGISDGQNLVPNPSFENYFNTFCGIMEPNDFNLTIMDWNNPTFGSTSAYFTNIDSTCYNFQPDSYYGGPIGIKGTQLPRTGNVMAGIWVFTIDGLNQRQYLQIDLETPMVAGKAYIISYHVSLADFIESSINSLGVHLSTTPVLASNDEPLDVIPQIIESSFVDEIDEWVLITDTIVADENYKYMTIGNFFNDASTMTQANPTASNEPGTYGAYYFVDDVSVEETVLTNTIDLDEDQFEIFPNPVNDVVTIKFSKNNGFVIKLFNLQGMELFSQSLDNQGSFQINCSNFPDGIYFVQIQNGMGSFTQKIIKY